MLGVRRDGRHDDDACECAPVVERVLVLLLAALLVHNHGHGLLNVVEARQVLQQIGSAELLVRELLDGLLDAGLDNGVLALIVLCLGPRRQEACAIVHGNVVEVLDRGKEGHS